MISSVASSNPIEYVLYIIIAFLILMVMVTVHESGHYLAGKLLHFKINEFAVGMGPKILSRKNKSGEIVSLRAFPLGGFCAFEGEDGDTDNPDAFNAQAPWKRIIVLFAGVFFNFVSAVIISAVLILAVGTPSIKVDDTYKPVNASENCRFKSGDVFYSINGKRVYFSMDVSDNLPSDGQSAEVVVVRDGAFVTLDDVAVTDYLTTDEEGNETTYKGVGIAMSGDFYRFGFIRGLGSVFGYVFAMAKLIMVTFGGLFTGAVGISELGGPVTTITMTAEIVSYGFVNVVVLFIFMSVNLAVFNLIPFPALDGCQIVFTAIEWVIGKPLNPKVIHAINTFGLIALLGFVVFVDLIKIWI